MNEQGISESWFDEHHTIPRRDFSGEFGLLRAAGTGEALAAGYLIAAMQNACLREMQHQIDDACETVIGTSIDVRRHASLPVGVPLRMTGWVVRIGERKATFEVRVMDHERTLCDGQMTFEIRARPPVDMPRARVVALPGCTLPRSADPSGDVDANAEVMQPATRTPSLVAT
ncbi:hypothetical protein LJR230_003313 [Trinickia sp. LjRoot230]|uniref:thioesterase family protein n=1 Tax=Trinickia sp. LjRoot230 TaxID=3342288 RepID=UPI003ECFB995